MFFYKVDEFKEPEMSDIKSGYVLHTERKWLAFHAENHEGKDVFFTRGPLGSLKNLVTNGLLVFLVRGENPHQIGGIGRFLGNDETTLEEAWAKYGRRTGNANETVYITGNTENVLKKDAQSTSSPEKKRVALIHVGNFQSIYPAVSTEIVGLAEVKHAARGWGLTFEECARAIDNLGSLKISNDQLEVEFDVSAEEGRRIQQTHLRIERDQAIVAHVKRQWTKSDPDLHCEICLHSFVKSYGEHGRNFIEAHHRSPLRKLAQSETIKTGASDFAPVCANCHRMLHRLGGITTDELRLKLVK